jgi:hypothetical protein
MTLDDFLSALENLIEDRETGDDEPGEGNFSCEDCRACNHCRFCIGCDTCEDCTYCDECMDCTSCTQSKRCVSCEKVSYCDDSRDCKGSRYLTLCVACSDCVHCLACVGLSGAEFYVLNERRTRKEYFALLRQVQELMQIRMAAGWRPPGIGLASEVIDAVVANRDPVLSAAPWLVELQDEDETPDDLPEYREPESGDPYDSARPRPGRGLVEHEHDEHERDHRPYDPRDASRPSPESSARHPDDADRRSDPAISDWAREPPEWGSSYYADPGDDDRVRARGPHEPTRNELGRARPRQDYGEGLGLDLSADLDEPDAPRRQDQQRTQPFMRRAGHAPSDELPIWAAPPSRHLPDYPTDHDDHHDHHDHHDHAADEDPVLARREARWEDTRERTVARPPSQPGSRDAVAEPRGPAQDVPAPRAQVPSSPWEDQVDDRNGAAAKRGSLRQAGRPKRPVQPAPPREATGTGSFRTGSAPEWTGSAPPPERTDSASARAPSGRARTGSEGTHTGGTGLRLGRKPKRRR